MRLCEPICQQANKQSMKFTLGESVSVQCPLSLLTNHTPVPARAMEPVWERCPHSARAGAGDITMFTWGLWQGSASGAWRRAHGGSCVVLSVPMCCH